MRTRTVTETRYEYRELSDKVRDKVRQFFAAKDGYPFESKAFDTLRALAKAFGAELTNYEIDFFATSHSSATFNTHKDDESGECEITSQEIAAILATLGSVNPATGKGMGDCKLTGYCLDDDALDGVRAAYTDGEHDLDALLEAGFRAWLKAVQADCDDYYSDERFGETCEANGFEFCFFPLAATSVQPALENATREGHSVATFQGHYIAARPTV